VSMGENISSVGADEGDVGDLFFSFRESVIGALGEILGISSFGDRQLVGESVEAGDCNPSSFLPIAFVAFMLGAVAVVCDGEKEF